MRILSMLLAGAVIVMALPGIAKADLNAESRAEAIARIQERDPNYVGDIQGSGASGSHMGGSAMHMGDSPWEEYWVQDIDFRPFMARLHTILLEDPGFAACDMQSDVISMLEDMYLFNMGTMHSEMSISGDDISFMFHETVHELPADSAPAQMLAFADRPLDSFNLVDGGGFVMYAGANYVPQKLMIQLDELMRRSAEAQEGGGPLSEIFGEMDLEEIQQAMAMMKAMQIDKIVEQTLSGEMGMALFDMPDLGTLIENGDNIAPTDFTAAVAIGINDADYVREMIGTYGSEVGLTARTDSGSNGWDVFDVPFMPGMGIIMNESLVVACTNVDFVLGKLTDTATDSLSDCQFHMALNMSALDEKFVSPGMEMLAMEISDGSEDVYWPKDSMKYLWDLPEQDGLGQMTVTCHFGDGASSEMHMKKAVFQYMMYYLSTIGAGAIQSEMH